MPRRVGNRRRISRAALQEQLCTNCAAQPIAIEDRIAKHLGLCVSCVRSATPQARRPMMNGPARQQSAH